MSLALFCESGYFRNLASRPIMMPLKMILVNFQVLFMKLILAQNPLFSSKVIGPNRNVVCHSAFSVDQAISEILVLDSSCCLLK